MKKRILLLFSLFFLGAVANAQSTFVKTLGGAGDDIAHSAIETNDGNYLVIGLTTSFGSGGSDAYISKINSSAKVIWDKAVGGSGDEKFQSGIQLSDGDFILVGSTSSFGNGGEDLLVSRVSNFGDIEWTRTFGGANDEVGHAALETSDGNILIGGHTRSFGAGELDVIIIKINNAGDELWSKTYGTSGNDWFNGQGLLEDSAGNYVVTGSWWRGNGSTPHDGFFMKLDTDGNIIILNGYGESGDEGLTGFLRETTAGFQNIGISWSWNGPDHEIWMSDFDFDGNLNWSKTFGLPGENIRIGHVQYTSDGNYLVSGYEFSQHTNAIGKSLLLKVSTSGDILWSKEYSDSGIETLDVVFETMDGVIAFGKTTSYGEGGNDIFVVRTDEFGTISGCSANLDLTITDVNPEFNNFDFAIEDHELGELRLLNESNVDNIENVICDGCDAADLEAGLFCDEAPIICSIDCLDGFTGTLPDEFLMPQPEPLCDGGIPNNVSWFAFVAGSNTIDLSIVPSNCTTIFDDTGMNPQTIGIQAGVYADCSFDESFICQTDGCLDLVAETINISSNQFEIGQVYYLFVDGCGGSVCDYEVVVNSAQQAFEMDEITTISNDLNIDLEQDTLCPGTQITFTLDNFDLDVDFNWSIDPPTVDYPSGVNSMTDTSSVTFIFSEEGCFDIHVYAFNECDNSETQTFTVCVEALEDEVFSDIYVCQECFPITLVAPESGCIITEGGGTPTVLTEDPNGDGVPGWLGTSLISGPGLDSNLVTNVLGCTYTQYVTVVEIPLSPREQVDYYFCLTDFPVDINGFTFNTPGETRNITLDGQAASGCDSLMSITAHALDIFGTSNIGNCEAGEVDLAFVVTNVMPASYDSITYTWYDENADIVTDADGIDSILVVMGVGSYSVIVEVHAGGVSCAQTFGPFMIDVDNLAPDSPTIGYAPIDVCVSELQAQIYVTNQGLSENYIWTFTPNVPISFGLTSDTVYVDLVDGQDFEFCVHAVNGCGSSEEICDNVIVTESPDSEFRLDTVVCVDSFAVVEYTGSFGTLSSSVFTWNFDGGTILNGADPSSGGPFEISFPSAGQYTVGLILLEAGCTSVLTEHTIEVVEPFVPPMIACESGSGNVVFSWDDTDVMDVNITVLSGQSSFDLMDNTYIVDGLSSEEEVTIQIEFNAGDACGGVTIIENCTSLPCPDVELEVALSDQNLCLEDASDVILNITVNGDDSGTGTWDSPFIYDDNIFNITEAGIGEHLITYTYIIEDCTYTEDTLISIFDSPEVLIDVFPSYCEDMGSHLIDVITASTNVALLDDFPLIVFNDIAVAAGDHTITVTSQEGCSKEVEFTIDSVIVQDLAISGDSLLMKGESNTYEVSINTNLDDLTFVWTLNGDTICTDCDEVEISPEEESELCVQLSYGSECFWTDCLLITIGERTEIYIPNVFSPNNDNINDHFTINSNSSNAFINEVMIFDRWGELVYNQKGFNAGEDAFYWDGTLNGTMCVPGVYVYLISYIDEENQVRQVSGDLTLVR